MMEATEERDQWSYAGEESMVGNAENPVGVQWISDGQQA